MILANIVAIVVLGLFIWRRGRDQRVRRVKAAQGLRIAGLVPLGLQVAIFLLFGIGEMVSGEVGGAGHLLGAAPIILLGALVWMRPLEGGVALFACGLIGVMGFAIARVASTPPAGAGVISPGLMLTAAPLLVSGVLFFSAGMLARRALTPGTDQVK